MIKANSIKTVVTIATLIFIFAAVVLGVWWYFSDPTTPTQGAFIDRSTLTRPHLPRAGSADAPVVLVEFFDPACGTCRSFYPTV